MERWEVIVMPRAKKQLLEIKDQRVQQQLKKSLKRLEYEPDRQGKPLVDDLLGYRSLRAVGQRYRIIYRVKAEVVEVLVVTVGIRKRDDKVDAYEVAKKLLRLGLLEPEEPLIEQMVITPAAPFPLTGRVKCPACQHAQPIALKGEEILEGNRFVRSCASCREEFICKLDEQDFVQAVLRLFGPGR
jgi:mRNA interferase RelE/StbE